MSGLRRRTLLSAGAASTLLAGCGAVARTAGLGDLVRVAVSWSATELAAFRDVMAGSGVDDYELIPFGDDIDAALGARTTGRPNVVALPRPGYVAANLANLEPLPDDVWQDEYGFVWGADLPAGGLHYALPFKLSHKSVVWYRKDVFAGYGLRPPATWEEWLALGETILGERELGAPLALGGADGWMLTGFFGNILLRNFAPTYEALARQPHDPRLWDSDDVRDAFAMLGEMWGRPGMLAGGVDRALAQQFPDALLEVFRYHRAVMVAAPDFSESVIRHFGVRLDEVDTFTFPARLGPGGPIVLAGDLLVLTRPATEESLRLIRYLAQPQAPVPWIRDTGGFIAANPRTDRGHYSPTLRRLAAELRPGNVVFDLSDQLGPAGGRDGLQRVLRDFLRDVGGGRPRRDAARAAASAMVRAEER